MFCPRPPFLKKTGLDMTMSTWTLLEEVLWIIPSTDAPDELPLPLALTTERAPASIRSARSPGLLVDVRVLVSEEAGPCSVEQAAKANRTMVTNNLATYFMWSPCRASEVAESYNKVALTFGCGLTLELSRATK